MNVATSLTLSYVIHIKMSHFGFLSQYVNRVSLYKSAGESVIIEQHVEVLRDKKGNISSSGQKR